MPTTFVGYESKANTNFINQLLDNVEIVVTDNVAMATASRNELAELLDKDVRTITRSLDRLAGAGIIKVEFKRGSDGGYVVMFNPDQFEFENIDRNILTDPTRHDVSLIDRVMPSKCWRKHGVRLNKMQLEAYHKQQALLEERDAKYNAQLKKYYDDAFSSLIPWEFFESTEDPELYYKAYLLSKTYDTVAVAWDRYIVRMHEHDVDNNIPEAFVRGWANNRRRHSDDYRSLNPAGWFGSSNWDTAIRLVKWLEETYPGTNPMRYMQALFEQEYGYYAWRKSKGDTNFKLYFPNFRQLNHKQFVARYNKRLQNQKVTNKMHMNNLPVDDIASTRIKTVARLWDGIINDREQASVTAPHYINSIVPDQESNNIISQNLTKFLGSLMSNMEMQKEERDLTDKDMEIVHQYMDEQFAILQGEFTMKDALLSTNVYASFGYALIEAGREIGVKGNWDIKPDKLAQIIDKVFPDFALDPNATYIRPGKNYVKNMKTVEGVMYEDYMSVSMLQTFDLVSLAKQRNKMYNSFDEIRGALDKVKDLVPMDRLGMLDFSKLEV